MSKIHDWSRPVVLVMNRKTIFLLSLENTLVLLKKEKFKSAQLGEFDESDVEHSSKHDSHRKVGEKNVLTLGTFCV